MNRVLHLALAAILLLIVGLVPRHWWTGKGHEVGLLSERSDVSDGAGHKKQVRSLSEGTDGLWPQAGQATFYLGFALAGLLAVAWLLRALGASFPAVPYAAVAAAGLLLVAALIFVFTKPAAFADVKLNVGFFIVVMAALLGALSGAMLGRGV